nr:MAG TPA: Protein of unknown function (DUF551) [Caudoviricetes sp.]
MGEKNILLNSRTIMCMRGAMAKHHGAPLMDLQWYGSMPNWQRVRIRMKMSRIKNRISETVTEACGYSPLTKVISEEEINRILAEEEKTGGWIPVTERLPEDDKYIMVSFDNFTLPDIGRYEVDKDGNGAFYPGDDEKSYTAYDLYVNAWIPLPEPYRESEE